MKKTAQILTLVAAILSSVTVSILADDSPVAKKIPNARAAIRYIGTPVPTIAYSFFRDTFSAACRAYHNWLKRS